MNDTCSYLWVRARCMTSAGVGGGETALRLYRANDLKCRTFHKESFSSIHFNVFFLWNESVFHYKLCGLIPSAGFTSTPSCNGHSSLSCSFGFRIRSRLPAWYYQWTWPGKCHLWNYPSGRTSQQQQSFPLPRYRTHARTHARTPSLTLTVFFPQKFWIIFVSRVHTRVRTRLFV